MPLIRLVLFGFLLLGLLLFYVQNASTTLPLVFLNIRFLNLPVAVWVLTAFAAGVLTMLIVAGLASLGSVPVRPVPRPRRAKESFRQSTSQFYEPPRSTVREPEPTVNSSPESSRQSTWQDSRTTWQDDDSFERDRRSAYNSAPDDTDGDDWEDASDWFDDGGDRRNDWDWDEEPVDRPRDQGRGRESFNDDPPPKSNSQSGSTYSFGYQNPGGSGVGRTEPVVDADYRVIVPPYRSLDDVQDDDFGDDSRDRPRQP